MSSTHSSFSRRRFFHLANSINDDSSSKACGWLAYVHSIPLKTQVSHLHKIHKCISGDGSLRICNILHIKQTSTIPKGDHSSTHKASCAHFVSTVTYKFNQQFSCYMNSLRDMSRTAVRTLRNPWNELKSLELHEHHNICMNKVLVHWCTLQPDTWICHMATPHCTTHLKSKTWWTVYSNIITSSMLKIISLCLKI